MRYQHADVVQRIRAKRLRWVGHVVRMEPETPTKKVFTSDPDGYRSYRWVDLVEADTPMLRTTARNRTSWRKHVDEAESTT